MTRVLIVLFAAMAAADAGSAIQGPASRINQFRAVHVSSGELKVVVQYTFVGPGNSGATIAATPQEAGGVFDPRLVDFDAEPAHTGTHTVTLRITKRPEAREFTSVAIRVCIAGAHAAIVCEDFARAKTWRTPGNQATTGAGTCSIDGEISGPLTWIVATGRGEHVTFKFSDVVLTAPGAPPRRVPLQNRRYTIANLPAGIHYRIVPSNYRADPAARTVDCVPNRRYHGRDFRLTGPPPVD
jgi:hypothetical protein